MSLTLLVGLLIILAAVGATARQIDVRLSLFLAALALGFLAGQPQLILQTFLATLSREQFVVPICSAMGFAYVLRLTECDRHLVQLLVKPLRRVRFLLIPGAVLVGCVVNIPIISQTSTAVTVGAVLVPLLVAARLSPVTIGAAILLGSSIGGELLNPGAPELQTVSTALGIKPGEIVGAILPLLAIQFTVATTLFWWLSVRADRTETPRELEPAPVSPDFRVNPVKAMVPLVPLVLLFLTSPPLNVFSVPVDWLASARELAGQTALREAGVKVTLVQPATRLIGLAMLIGAGSAALTSRKHALESARAFFEGAGYAFTHIISLIVTANCFGVGVTLIGVAAAIEQLTLALPGILVPLAGSLPLGFAVLCGSGMAATQSVYSFFVTPARSVGLDPVRIGALVSLAAAAGRTMSPVAAVTLMSATMTGASPIRLALRVAMPLLLGVVVMVAAAIVWPS